MAILKAFKILNIAATLRKISVFIDQIEAITTLFEKISKIVEKEAKENGKLLNLTVEKIEFIEKTVKKIEKIDRKFEKLQKTINGSK